MEKNSGYDIFEKTLVLIFPIFITELLMKFIKNLVENVWLERGIGILIVAIIGYIVLKIMKVSI